MKGIGLAIAFLVLVAGLPVLRSFRFERAPGAATTTLADLQAMPLVLPRGAKWSGTDGQPVLNLVASKPGGPRSYRIILPDRKPVEALHVRIDAAASNLLQGKNSWDDGRVLVEWRSPDDSVSREVDPICSNRGNEVEEGLSIVMRPNIRPSLPVLRIENLGKAGELSVTRLELTPVRERQAWRSGRWLLLGAWCVWLYAFLSWSTSAAPWKKLLSTLVWAGMCLVFVFPGPWKTLHSLGLDYRLGKGITAPPALKTDPNLNSPSAAVPPSSADKPSPLAPVDSTPVPAPKSAGAQPLDQIQVADGWILKAKRMFVNERPLLHAFLLMVPTFLFAWLVGIRAACILGVGTAVSIELAQVAFGFGADLKDIGDLLSDAVGIALAIGFHLLWKRWLEKRKHRHG
jgi:hypothetical protein